MFSTQHDSALVNILASSVPAMSPMTRNQSAHNVTASSSQEETPQRHQTITTDKQVPVEAVTSDCELDSLLNSLSEESKTLVKILKIIITQQFKSELDLLKKEVTKKDETIANLSEEIKVMKQQVQALENTIDTVDQYERRDTIIFSGPAIPDENRLENASETIINVVKDNLRINLKDSDINVAHRLGPIQTQRKRPIIVKLSNRALKNDLVGACVQLRPPLHINESLTPRRLHLFKQVLNIRKNHKDKFQQCFTKDGKITIKLKNSTYKHVIVDEVSFHSFLDKYPTMKDTYHQLLVSA